MNKRSLKGLDGCGDCDAQYTEHPQPRKGEILKLRCEWDCEGSELELDARVLEEDVAECGQRPA